MGVHREAAQRACDGPGGRSGAVGGSVEVGAHVLSDIAAESLSLTPVAQLTSVVVQRLSSLSTSVPTEAVPLRRP